MLGLIWAAVCGVFLFSIIIDSFSTRRGIKKSDIYGEYIIDRSKFSGKQANWQYANYRFTVTKENQLIFYQTKGRTFTRADTFDVDFVGGYLNDRIRFTQDSNRHHIISENPTLYRKQFSFYYVFHSEKFGNVFFKKGKWKELN